MNERNEELICTHCGQIIENEDDVFLVHDEVVCRDCVDNCCTTCDRCGTLIYDDDVYGDDDHCLDLSINVQSLFTQNLNSHCQAAISCDKYIFL